MQVTFYSFTKKENSTARPGSGTSYECILKSPSSIVSPVITLQIGRVTDPSGYNYCYIPDFDRFYWISEWSWSNACWTASLKCDVLATYKDQIGSASLYALRASNSYDGDIIDNMYPTKSAPVFVSVKGSYPWNYSSTQAGIPLGFGLGTFILLIAGEGISKSIAMSYDALQNLAELLSGQYVTEDNGFDLNDASFKLQASMIDPFQYIKSCKFFPFPYAELGGGQTGLTIGSVTFDSIPWKLAPSGMPLMPIPFQLPLHPYTNSRGKYLNTSATVLRLFIPPFGIITLTPDLAYNYRYCTATINVDYESGNARCIVGYSNSAVDYEVIETVLSQRVGIDIQLSQIYTDYYEGLNVTHESAAQVLGAGLSLNIGGIISSETSGIVSQNRAMRPRLDTLGDSSGGFTALSGIPDLTAEFLVPVEDDISHNGRPLCRVITPAALGGYILIQDGDVPIPGTAEEAAEVRSYLEGGFYYE